MIKTIQNSQSKEYKFVLEMFVLGLFCSDPIHHFTTPQICLVTQWRGPEPPTYKSINYSHTVELEESWCLYQQDDIIRLYLQKTSQITVGKYICFMFYVKMLSNFV